MEHSLLDSNRSSGENDPVYQPVLKRERLPSMDILRGVAVLGIFIINIEMFATPWQNMLNPTLSDAPQSLGYYVWFLKQFVFQGKMWALFSMLFGAGAFLLITRAENQGKAAGIADIYYRRLLWLLLFGLVHAYLVWSGDVLYFYALVGLFLYPVRKLSVRSMLVATAVLLILSMLIRYLDEKANVVLQEEVVGIEALVGMGEDLTEEQQAVLDEWNKKNAMFNPNPESLQKSIEAIRSGTYLGIVKSESKLVHYTHTDMFYGSVFFQVLLMMVLGMAMIKAGILSAHSRRSFYLSQIALGYTIGFALVIFRIQSSVAHDFNFLTTSRLLENIEIIAVALGHVGLICLFCTSNLFGWMKASLAAVGRMAFTNYILQSVIGTLLFYGYGLGLYASMNRAEQLWVVGAVWLLQMAVSPLWLKYFRFGPLEWIWRSLTYWRVQPMIASQ